MTWSRPIRLEKGHSLHLGGPWYFTRSPDSGRYYFAKDAGTGTVEVPPHAVPEEKAPTRRLADMTAGDRRPYVGAGAEGARRSAQIDREELDTLAKTDPRRPELEDSERRWLDQAARLEEHDPE